MAGQALIRQPVCFEAADARTIHCFCTSAGGLVARAVYGQTKAAECRRMKAVNQ